MNENSTCAIWGTPATEVATDKDGRSIDSPRAGGMYFISGTAVPVLEDCDDRVKVCLTTWLVEKRRLGHSCPEITSKIANNAKYWRDKSVSDRTDSILKYLEKKSETLGTQIDYCVFPSFYKSPHLGALETAYLELLSHSGCVGRKDLVFLLAYLEECDLIGYSGNMNAEQACVLTVQGYARLADLEKTYTGFFKSFCRDVV